MASAGAALDSSNQFSQDAKDTGGVVAVIAAIYALANFDEVSYVLKNLNEADAHLRTLQAGMAQIDSEIRQQRLNLQTSESQITEIAESIASLQAQLNQA